MHRAQHRLQSDVVWNSRGLVKMRMKRPLLLLMLLHLVRASQALRYSNSFYYQDLSPDGNGNGEIYFSGVRLHVESPQALVSAVQGGNVTLPCVYRYEPEVSAPRRTRVKWFWQPSTGETKELHVMAAFGSRHRSYGDFRGRVRLRRSTPGDASLVINPLLSDDTGRYRCEIIDGLEDESITVELQFRGEVYFLHHQHNLNFSEAVEKCVQDGAQIAKVGQLYAAWRFAGLDQCDAGWVADGSVRYPITNPRANCGPFEPGVRSFGFPPQHLKYGVYCHKVRW